MSVYWAEDLFSGLLFWIYTEDDYTTLVNILNATDYTFKTDTSMLNEFHL